MKYCQFCQTEMEDEASFCPHCGKEQTEDERTSAAAEAPAEDTAAAEQTPAEETAATEPTADETAAEEGKPEEETSGEAASAEETSQIGEAPAKKTAPWKIAVAVVMLVALLLGLAASVVAGMGGFKKNDVTRKESYTVSDEKALAARDKVVATAGKAKLTNGQLQVYYWMEVQNFLNNYGAYAAYFGLDYTQPLDTQPCMEEGYDTWQQFFLANALNSWHLYQSLALEAEAEGLQLQADDRMYLDGLEQTMEEVAVNYNTTVADMLKSNIGPGAGFEEFKWYQENNHMGITYYENCMEKLVPTDEELEAFFDSHAEDYAANGITKDALLVDVRHILISPEGGTTDETGITTYSDEEWEACEAAAQQLLDRWLEGEKTEESFAALANENSQDGGSNTNGGLYENVYTGQMVPTFDEWCFDESRQSGDYGLVKTDFGYHIMYFVTSRDQWRYCAESDWVNEQTSQILDNAKEKYPMKVKYGNIVLGLATMD